jgi:hypothetical protein
LRRGIAQTLGLMSGTKLSLSLGIYTAIVQSAE